MIDRALARAERLLQSHHAGVVAALLGLFVVSGALSLARDSATFDETAHIPAGYTYLDRGDFRLNPEHPPLAKAWAALPLWIGGLGNPDYGSAAWAGRPQDGTDGTRSKASEWSFGYTFINGAPGDPARRDPRVVLVPARLAMLVPGVLLGLVVYAWSRRLWGPSGALLSLTVYALSPTMLAHTRLVTTDLPNALAYAATLYGFWRYTTSPSWPRAVGVGVCCALALLTKFSALLLGPVLVAGSVAWILAAPDKTERGVRLRHATVAGGLAVALCLFALWAGYGFRFAAAADPAYRMDWDVVGLRSGLLADAIHRALDLRMLPEAWLYGLAYFLGGAARRLAYLNGALSIHGWWYYFPEAFLLKTPPATLALAVWLGLRTVLSRRFGGLGTALPALAIAIYVGVSMASNLNIGHRHLTPLYPLLFVLFGAFPSRIAVTRPKRIGLAALLIGSAVSWAAATPGYLSYFNRLAGGPHGGPRFLLDSNVDWGQDLVRLKRWMDNEGIDTIHLAYFGTADPAAHGIRFRKVHRVHDFDPRGPVAEPGAGELLAVSVNFLWGLYFDDERAIAEGLIRRGWVGREEIREWLASRNRATDEGREHPGLADWLEDRGRIDTRQRETVEGGLLSTRLRRLRESEVPLARAGDSIVVYRVPAAGL